MIHPAKFSKCCPITLGPKDDYVQSYERVEIFTDGSKFEGKVGCAFVVYWQGIEIANRKFKLPNHCSAYQAELTAIEKAIIHQNVWSHACRKVTIFSDCNSALQTIADTRSDSSIVQNIHQMIKNVNNLDIRLKWIKAHVGHIGNERADDLARLATKGVECLELDAPLTFVKLSLEHTTLNNWRDEWENSTNGKWTKVFFPTLTHRTSAKELRSNFYNTQFLTGHGKFGSYLKRFHIRTDDACKCGETQTSLHLPRYCREFNSTRNHFLNTLAHYSISTDYDLTEIFKQKDIASEFNTLVEIIHKQLIDWEKETTNIQQSSS